QMPVKHSNTKTTIVLLWIAVSLNIIFADIFSIIIEFVDGGILEIPIEAKTMMAIAAILTNIQILMVVLTWVLPHRVNRIANLIAAPITILYVIGGGSLLPHYLIMVSIEVILLVWIIVLTWKWQKR
ncbi:MAG: DUF6326 family protein, partial [Bacteroidota bacterium]